MAASDKPAVVIDNGNGLMKAGFAGADQPASIFPTVFGSLREYLLASVKPEDNVFYFSEEARLKRGILTLQYPINGNTVDKWDEMEQMWRYVYDKRLNVDPKDQSLLLTESCTNLTASREKTAEILFEKFGVPALHLHPQPELSLFACGLTHGLVVESGHRITQTMAVGLDAQLPAPVCQRIGGWDLSCYLMKILIISGWDFNYQTAQQTVHEMKEKLCYVAQDFDEEMRSSDGNTAIEEKYELLNLEVITVGNERFRSPEALFRPEWLDLEFPGIHETAFTYLMSCDEGCRGKLAANVVLSGGNAKLPGFATRLEKEMNTLAAGGLEVKVRTPPQPEIGAWVGGSILAAMPTFAQSCIGKKEFEEEGGAVLERKR